MSRTVWPSICSTRRLVSSRKRLCVAQEFEVWTPGRASEAPAGLRSAVRLDLPQILARRGRGEAQNGRGMARRRAVGALGVANRAPGDSSAWCRGLSARPSREQLQSPVGTPRV